MSEEPNLKSSAANQPSVEYHEPVASVDIPAAYTMPPPSGSASFYDAYGLSFGLYDYPRYRAEDIPKIQEDLGEQEARIKDLQRRQKLPIILLLLISALGLIFLFLGLSGLFLGLIPQLFGYGGLIAFAGGSITAVIVWIRSQARISRLQANIDSERSRLRVISQFALGIQEAEGKEEKAAFDYFDTLVRINVGNLSDYYTMVKIHTDNSFRVSVVSGIVGFAFIIIGLLIGLIGGSDMQAVAFVSAASGVIVEFITGVFFYLYNRTVRQLKEYHDSLLAVQNILLAFKIVGDTKDEKEKTKMVGQMLTFLVGKPPVPTFMKSEEG